MTTPHFDAQKAHRFIKERNFDAAISACESLLASEQAAESDKKNALHMLGTAFYMQGKLGKSIEQFKKLLAMDPKHTDAAISLSVIYNDIGKYDEAKKNSQGANQSLQLKRKGSDEMLDRKFALKHIELGDLYLKYHRYDDALDDYSRAARLAPADLSIRIKLAKVYAKKGFTTRAIQELQQLCNEHPEYTSARLHLGLMYFSQGNVIDAQLEWEKARNQDPNNPELQTYLNMASRATETSV